MKKKTACCMLLASAFFLSSFGTSHIMAKEAGKGITISYEAIAVKVQGAGEVIKGTTGHIYKGYVGEDLGDVIWSVKNATSADTKIDETGKLQIGIDETATTLQIEASLKSDPTKKGTMDVDVIDKTYTVIEIEKKDDISVPFGTSEDELSNVLEKYKEFNVTIETNDGQRYEINVDEFTYESLQEVVQEDNTLISGVFDLLYELELPYIEINYDGTIVIDTERNTNILGNNKTQIKVNVGEGGISEVPNETKPEAPIKNTSSPQTGDYDNHMLAFSTLGIVALGCIFILVLTKRNKKDEEL